jgi:hypothetical protein
MAFTPQRAKLILNFLLAARAIRTRVLTSRFCGAFSIAEILELGIPALAASLVCVSPSSWRNLAI